MSRSRTISTTLLVSLTAVVCTLVGFYVINDTFKSIVDAQVGSVLTKYNTDSTSTNATTSNAPADGYNFIDDPSVISVPNPATLSAQTRDDDLDIYHSVVEQTAPVYLKFPQYDDIFAVRFGDYNYLDLYNEYERPITREFMDKFESDLISLTENFYYQYEYEMPQIRHDEVNQLLPLRSPSYPPARVVGALGVETFLATVDPANEEQYLGASDEYITRGIAYGLYLPSDIAAAGQLLDQYMEAISDNQEFQRLVTAARAEFE